MIVQTRRRLPSTRHPLPMSCPTGRRPLRLRSQPSGMARLERVRAPARPQPTAPKTLRAARLRPSVGLAASCSPTCSLRPNLHSLRRYGSRQRRRTSSQRRYESCAMRWARANAALSVRPSIPLNRIESNHLRCAFSPCVPIPPRRAIVQHRTGCRHSLSAPPRLVRLE